MSAKTVFISYRRDTVGKLFARTLKNELTHRGYDVFLDVDCIDAGKWAEQILTQVPIRAHFLILLTPGAFDRCRREDDWVRREYESARASGRNLVPVRTESVDLGEFRKSCPVSMQGVFDFQVAEARHGDFDHDIDTLVQRYIPHPTTRPKGRPAGLPYRSPWQCRDQRGGKDQLNLNPAVGWPKRTENDEKNESSEAAAVHPAGECPRLRKALGLFVFFRFFRLNCCF